MSAAVSAEPLGGNVLLPFGLWRVAALIDGRRSLEDLAAGAAISVQAAQGAVAAIERELGVRLTEGDAAPAAEVTPVGAAQVGAIPAAQAVPGGPDLILLLTRTAVDLMGPMGEVLVEDALDDLGENPGAAELISRVALELREPQRGAFLARLRAKGLT